MENVKTLEAKKAQELSDSKSQDTSLPGSSIFDFIGDVKAELKKIDWTSPEELQVYTKIVVAGTFILGLGIYVFDVLVQGLLSGLNAFVHLLTG